MPSKLLVQAFHLWVFCYYLYEYLCKKNNFFRNETMSVTYSCLPDANHLPGLIFQPYMNSSVTTAGRGSNICSCLAPACSMFLNIPVPSCTCLYILVQSCKFLYIPVHSCTFLYIIVYSCTFLYITLYYSTCLYILVHSCKFLYIPVHFSTFLYIPLHSCTFLYSPVHYSTCLYLPVHSCKFL